MRGYKSFFTDSTRKQATKIHREYEYLLNATEFLAHLKPIITSNVTTPLTRDEFLTANFLVTLITNNFQQLTKKFTALPIFNELRPLIYTNDFHEDTKLSLNFERAVGTHILNIEHFYEIHTPEMGTGLKSQWAMQFFSTDGIFFQLQQLLLNSGICNTTLLSEIDSYAIDDALFYDHTTGSGSGTGAGGRAGAGSHETRMSHDSSHLPKLVDNTNPSQTLVARAYLFREYQKQLEQLTYYHAQLLSSFDADDPSIVDVAIATIALEAMGNTSKILHYLPANDAAIPVEYYTVGCARNILAHSTTLAPCIQLLTDAELAKTVSHISTTLADSIVPHYEEEVATAAASYDTTAVTKIINTRLVIRNKADTATEDAKLIREAIELASHERAEAQEQIHSLKAGQTLSDSMTQVSSRTQNIANKILSLVHSYCKAPMHAKPDITKVLNALVTMPYCDFNCTVKITLPTHVSSSRRCNALEKEVRKLDAALKSTDELHGDIREVPLVNCLLMLLTSSAPGRDIAHSPYLTIINDALSSSNIEFKYFQTNDVLQNPYRLISFLPHKYTNFKLLQITEFTHYLANYINGMHELHGDKIFTTTHKANKFYLGQESHLELVHQYLTLIADNVQIFKTHNALELPRALCGAATCGANDLVAYLLKTHSFTDEDIAQAAQCCITQFHTQTLLLLSPNAESLGNIGFNDYGDGALNYASYMNEIELIQALLSLGMDADTKSHTGCTPLYVAAERSSIEAIDILLAARANINAQAEGRHNMTPLMIAAQKGRADVVAHLLTSGADTTICGVYHHNALSIAVQNGQLDVVKILVNNGMNIYHTLEDGCPLIYIAEIKGNKQILEFLSSQIAEDGMHADMGHSAAPTVMLTAHEDHKVEEVVTTGDVVASAADDA